MISDLGELPERQRGALVMRELGGLDFAEIGTALGTSSAVARQTIYEARLSLRQMNEGREMSCETVTRTLSDGDGRVTRRRDVRAHLRACSGCRGFHEEIESRERDLAALSPLPAAAAAGLLRGVLGGHASGGNGLVGAFGGGAVKSLGASAALKGTATVAVVAALGVGAADRGGLVDVPRPGADGSTSTYAEHLGGIESAEAKPIQAGSTTVGATTGPPTGEEGAVPVGAVQAADPDTETTSPDPETAGPDQEKTATPTESQWGGDSAAHSHGKGHEKQLPEASAHGQETAAAHNHGPAGAPSHPAHPEHPTKPTKPAKPEQPSNPKSEKESPSAPPDEAAAEADGPESTPPGTDADESSPGKKHGKKP
jgi:Sigma-70, region 4